MRGQTKRNTAKIIKREKLLPDFSRYLYQRHDICSICKGRSRRWKSLTFHCFQWYINRRYGHIVLNCQTKCMVSFVVFCIVFFKCSLYHPPGSTLYWVRNLAEAFLDFIYVVLIKASAEEREGWRHFAQIKFLFLQNVSIKSKNI